RDRKVTISLEKFESDRVLEAVIRKHSDGLVLGWASESPCQPLYSTSRECPVTQPEYQATFQPGYEKFALQEFLTPKGFDPAKTPMISFVTPLDNLPEYSQAAKHAGYFNTSLDSDATIRRANLFTIANGKPYPSLALEMARVGLNESLR